MEPHPPRSRWPGSCTVVDRPPIPGNLIDQTPRGERPRAVHRRRGRRLRMFQPRCPLPQGEAPHVAEISIWLDCHDRRGPLRRPSQHWWGCASPATSVGAEHYTDYGEGLFESSAHGLARCGRRQFSPCAPRPPTPVSPKRSSCAAMAPARSLLSRPSSAAPHPVCPQRCHRRRDRGYAGGPGIKEEAWRSGGGHHRPDAFLPRRRRSLVTAELERMLESVLAFIDMDRIGNLHVGLSVPGGQPPPCCTR